MVYRSEQSLEQRREYARNRSRKFRLLNREKENQKLRDWRVINREGYLAIQKRYRDKKLKELEAAAGKPKPSFCELCGGGEEKICWDHNHGTGKFRGWICQSCNSALGMVRDNVTVLANMITYIKNDGFKS